MRPGRPSLVRPGRLSLVRPGRLTPGGPGSGRDSCRDPRRRTLVRAGVAPVAGTELRGAGARATKVGREGRVMWGGMWEQVASGARAVAPVDFRVNVVAGWGRAGPAPAPGAARRAGS